VEIGENAVDFSAMTNPEIQVAGDITSLLPDSDSKSGSQLGETVECTLFGRFNGCLQFNFWIKPGFGIGTGTGARLYALTLAVDVC
jgi:hypothetical protein